MGLNIFEQLERVANEESRELHGILKKFSREDFTEQLVKLQNDIETCNIELLETQTQIDDFDSKKHPFVLVCRRRYSFDCKKH